MNEKDITRYCTLGELEFQLGEHLRKLRLIRNIDQKTLAARAGISCRALQNLEAGSGSTVKTLLSAVRALDREDWLSNLAPIPSINPLTMTKSLKQRQRAGKVRRVTIKSGQ